MLWCYYHSCAPIECGGPHDKDGVKIEAITREAPKLKTSPRGRKCDWTGCPGDHPTGDNYCSMSTRIEFGKEND